MADKKLAGDGQAAGKGGSSSPKETDPILLSKDDKVGDVPFKRVPKTAAPRTPQWLVRVSRAIAQSNNFSLFTMLLTIYALIGDDFKVLLWEQPADFVFNIITILVIVVFCIEIVVSSIGKDGYFGSFFFHLDIISTITLLLDLDVVDEMANSMSSDEARSSRTARLGAKAGRVVRVLRLVRILKLYKAIYEARQAKKRREDRENRTERGLEPVEDDDDWDDINVDKNMDTLQKESNVGKKLSERTIRKVIILVLAMILSLPFFELEDFQKYTSSAQYCSNIVWDKFQIMLNAREDCQTNCETSADFLLKRSKYREAFLQCVYYHNWFFGDSVDTACPHGNACSQQMVEHPFWVGIEGPAAEKELMNEMMGLARVPIDFTDQFEASYKDEVWSYNFGTMPTVAKQAIADPWYDCKASSSNRASVGFSLIQQEMLDTSIVSRQIDYAVRCPSNIRYKEREFYYPELSVYGGNQYGWRFIIWFDKRPRVKSEAILALAMMCFICATLLTVSMFLSNDANKLVLHPVENMISKVEMIRDNPLMAMKMADDEFKAEEMERAKAKRLKNERESRTIWTKVYNTILCTNDDAVKVEPMETVILEKTIIKLGSLLAPGFGEAGSSIIEHNMHGVDSACVDAMVEGTRVECIIGATRIRDFSTATEVLQHKVMTFVNQIAEIVHGVVDEFHGAANKNNGDTFLMIWRTSDLEDDAVSKLADMSMLAFARILGAVHRSPVLAAYRGHPGLQQRLGKNCRVTLSSGLHYGWAIEGAVGSEFKIDASYLSPNVSIAETIERATMIYGVSMLVAESVVTICTPDMAAKCRLIDRVIITGSVDYMELHAIDLDYSSLTVEPPMAQFNMSWNSRQRFKARQFLEAEKAEKWHDDVNMVSFFNENPDIAAMRFRYTLEFIHVFNMGFQNYAQGEWQVAQRLLSRTRTMLGVQDGPSAALLRFMKSPHNYEAPEGWTGIRELGMALLG
jgi:class 3 adenylate cyclase